MFAFSSYDLSLPSLLNLAGIFAVMAAFALIGAAIAGPRRNPALDVFVGWGASLLVFVVLGVGVGLSLKLISYGLFAAALGCVLVLKHRGEDFRQIAGLPSLWRLILLGAPLLLLIAPMQPSQWDEFSHWMPNVLYLLQNDAFPQADLPKSLSQWPAYPYGVPLVSAMASHLIGDFVESGGPLFNTLLLFALAPLALDLVGRGLKAKETWGQTWPAAALGFLLVTVLSTTFVQKLVFTGYGEAATAALLAAIAMTFWRLMEAFDETATVTVQESRPALAWQIGLMVAAFLFVKQTNLILFALTGLAVLLIVARDPALSFRQVFLLAPRVLIPGLAVVLLWRYHVQTHMPGGEFSLLPVAEWRLQDAWAILERMGAVALKKGPYFLMMAGLSLFALGTLFRPMTSTRRLALMAVLPFLGFIAFLWVMYMTAFSDWEASKVASFWRYNTQLGLLGVCASGYLIARAVADRPKVKSAAYKVGLLLTALIPVLPIVFSEKIRFDIRPQKAHVRAVVDDLAAHWDQKEELFVIDPKGNGLVSEMIAYHFLRHGLFQGRIVWGLHNETVVSARLLARLEELKATAVLVHEPLPAVQTALGVSLTPQAVHLLRKRDGAWRAVKAWPYPGYVSPYDLPD